VAARYLTHGQERGAGWLWRCFAEEVSLLTTFKEYIIGDLNSRSPSHALKVPMSGMNYTDKMIRFSVIGHWIRYYTTLTYMHWVVIMCCQACVCLHFHISHFRIYTPSNFRSKVCEQVNTNRWKQKGVNHLVGLIPSQVYVGMTL
jgi:hypothetical protein